MSLASTAPTPRTFARSLALFALTLVALDLAAGALFRRYASPLVQGELVTRTRWLAAQPRPAVLFLGDSAVHRGFSPAALRSAGGPAALNAGITAGTTLVAHALARDVAWRPDETVYGAVPVQLLDTFPLQQSERAVVSLFEPRALRIVTADVALGRVFHIYGRRRAYLTALEDGARSALLRERDVLPAPENDPFGFSLTQGTQPVTAAQCRAGGAALAQSWVARPAFSGGLRAHYLARTFDAWGPARPDAADARRRTAVLMPFCSAMREAVYARIARRTLVDTWIAAAADARAALLDCTEALDDAAFYDADHLRAEGAREFTQRFAPWFARREVPRGCVRLR